MTRGGCSSSVHPDGWTLRVRRTSVCPNAIHALTDKRP